MQQVNKAWEALQPVGPEAGISPYTIRVAFAGIAGVLFLLSGLFEVIYGAIAYGSIPLTGDDGFARVTSSFWVSSVFPVIPGVLAFFHYLRIKRCLEASQELEARRASNYARTWSQIALWTWIGLALAYLVALGIFVAAMALIFIVFVALIIGGLILLFSAMAGSGSGASSNRDSNSDGMRSDDVDDERTRRPGQRISNYSARMQWLSNSQKLRDKGRRWRW